MNDPCAAYIRQVNQKLDLPRRQKKQIMHGFQSEMEEKYSGVASVETLLADVGQPAEVADVLLEAVDLRKRARFNFSRLRWLFSIIILLSLLLTLSIGTFVYFDLTWVGRAEVTITEDAVPINYSTSTAERP